MNTQLKLAYVQGVEHATQKLALDPQSALRIAKGLGITVAPGAALGALAGGEDHRLSGALLGGAAGFGGAALGNAAGTLAAQKLAPESIQALLHGGMGGAAAGSALGGAAAGGLINTLD